MKQCLCCKQSKDLLCFSKHKGSKDGFQALCKKCQKIYRENLKKRPKRIVKKLRCGHCNIIKKPDVFLKIKASSTGYGSWCIECRQNYQKTSIFRQNTNNRRAKRVQWFRSIKSNTPCADCGVTLEPACMDYDHIGNDKIASVSRMVLDNTPKEKILDEIKKCELVCVLCHNRRTKKRLDDKGENKYPKHVQRNIDIINKAKSKPCDNCGRQYESLNMQFDHIDPNTKTANVCQLKSAKVSRLMAEIAKCRVICAICHRKKSLIEQKNKQYPKIRNKEVNKIFVDFSDKKKECTRCHEILDFSKFRKHKITKSGLDSQCRECANEAKREHRARQKQEQSLNSQ